MKSGQLIVFITLTVIGVIPASASGQPVCETTFDPPIGDEGPWDDDNNWTLRAPDPTLVGCIPPKKTAVIGPNVDAHAEAIWIKRDLTGTGTVDLKNDESLTLYANSQIDGKLLARYPNAQLIIDVSAGNVTITGGGEIVGGDALNPAERLFIPVIKTTGGANQLIVAGNNNSARSTSLVVRGTFDIQANLVNNAYVVADNRDTINPQTQQVDWFGDLVLSTNAKSGSGFWIAEKNTSNSTIGRLRVDVAVTGPGTWDLTDDKNAEIVINSDCVNLTGDVVLEKGTLDANASFVTTGDLQMKSISGSVPKISVAQGSRVKFSDGL